MQPFSYFLRLVINYMSFFYYISIYFIILNL